jgi:hypothetical protein
MSLDGRLSEREVMEVFPFLNAHPEPDPMKDRSGIVGAWLPPVS